MSVSDIDAKRNCYSKKRKESQGVGDIGLEDWDQEP
jgi:hypothetical protein